MYNETLGSLRASASRCNSALVIRLKRRPLSVHHHRRRPEKSAPRSPGTRPQTRIQPARLSSSPAGRDNRQIGCSLPCAGGTSSTKATLAAGLSTSCQRKTNGARRRPPVRTQARTSSPLSAAPAFTSLMSNGCTARSNQPRADGLRPLLQALGQIGVCESIGAVFVVVIDQAGIHQWFTRVDRHLMIEQGESWQRGACSSRLRAVNV